MRSFMICTASLSVVSVNKSRITRLVGHVARMGKRGAYTEFWRGNLGESSHLGDPGLESRMILRGIFRKWCLGIMGWIVLAQDTDRWRALVNAVMNLRVP
jgi:hypothetical protein